MQVALTSTPPTADTRGGAIRYRPDSCQTRHKSQPDGRFPAPVYRCC
jgi:hypothetical protein